MFNLKFVVEVLWNWNEDGRTWAIFHQPDIKILCSFIACPETKLGNSYLSKKILQQKREKIASAKIKVKLQ